MARTKDEKQFDDHGTHVPTEEFCDPTKFELVCSALVKAKQQSVIDVQRGREQSDRQRVGPMVERAGHLCIVSVQQSTRLLCITAE